METVFFMLKIQYQHGGHAKLSSVIDLLLMINGQLNVKFGQNIAHKHKQTLYKNQKLQTGQARVCNVKVMFNILIILYHHTPHRNQNSNSSDTSA
jgi:hypothetical protein